jgi:hypothetical protein
MEFLKFLTKYGIYQRYLFWNGEILKYIMKNYIENPKTKDSGILCAIPQNKKCPIGCKDCFFNSGRSYLEPMEKNLPNLPDPKICENKIIRINDGNDSNIDRGEVIEIAKQYKNYFFNTALPQDLETFSSPIVLTINPSELTDKDFNRVICDNLMFVRFRTNTWNLELCDEAVKYYSNSNVPIVLTFMAYHELTDIPYLHQKYYIERKRTLNSYFAITTAAWEMIMSKYKYNKFVYSCGKIEGELGDTHCKFCGNCLREYFNTKMRMENVLHL